MGTPIFQYIHPFDVKFRAGMDGYIDYYVDVAIRSALCFIRVHENFPIVLGCSTVYQGSEYSYTGGSKTSSIASMLNEGL